MADGTEKQDRKGERKQEELLKSLDESIWKEGCKPIGLIWKTLPRYYTDETLVKEHMKYQQALDIVELRLSRKVMSSYNQFVTAMNDVKDLGDDLHKSMTICRSSKESISSSRELLAVNGMTIVALYKRRQKQHAAFTLLVKLRLFLKARQEMNDRAKSGDFGIAFRLCMKIRDLYKHLSSLQCMQPIALSLKQDVDDLRAKVDRALGTLSRTNFHPETYNSILEAMVLMHGGKTMKILDSHTQHFKASVELATKRAIITTLLAEAEMFSPEELERLKIVTLCRRLAERHFPMCLNLMFEQFSNYLFTYHAIVAWLSDMLNTVKSSSESPIDLSGDKQEGNISGKASSSSSKANLNEGVLDEKTRRIYLELRDGLQKHKRVLWEQEMQQNVTLMMGALKVEELDVTTFMAILGSMSKFIEIVEEFGGTQAHTLREMFREHSRVFFAQFHRKRLELLKESIEKESWSALSDVKKDYGIRHFTDLNDIVLSTMPQQRAYKRRKQSFFDGLSVQSNPFASETDGVDIDELEMTGKRMKAIARYKWEESSANPELLVEMVDELGNTNQSGPTGSKRPTSPFSPMGSRKVPSSSSQQGVTSAGGKANFIFSRVPSGAPLIANIAKVVIQYIGEYMHMMQLIPQMAHIVFDGLVQCVEYFVFSIHSFFAVSRPTLSNGDRNLAIVLRRIQSDLMLDPAVYDALLSASLAAAAQAAANASSSHHSSLGSIATTTSSVLSGIKDTFSFSSGRDSDPGMSTSNIGQGSVNGPGASVSQGTSQSGVSGSSVSISLPAGTLSSGGVLYRTETNYTATHVKVGRARAIGLNESVGGNMVLQQQIGQAMVASGSLMFLRKVLVELQPNFLELLGRDRLAKVISFAGTLAETTVPLRLAIFKYAPQASILMEKQIVAVSQGRWDSLDEDVRESAYVKPLLKDVGLYIEKLKGMVKQGQMPAELLPEMVLQSLDFVSEICVEGFSKARRITTEGHNIMLYDMQEIKSGMEKIAGIRNHDWSFLDHYVHAYHFPCDDLLTFFREHPWYTKNQLTGLVVSGPWNQRDKTKLLDSLNYHGAFTSSSASNSRSTSSSTNRSRSTSTSTSSRR